MSPWTLCNFFFFFFMRSTPLKNSYYFGVIAINVAFLRSIARVLSYWVRTDFHETLQSLHIDNECYLYIEPAWTAAAAAVVCHVDRELYKKNLMEIRYKDSGSVRVYLHATVDYSLGLPLSNRHAGTRKNASGNTLHEQVDKIRKKKKKNATYSVSSPFVRVLSQFRASE